MAKKAKKTETKEGLKLQIVNPDAAGIDIADGEMQVCVPADRDAENNRRFGSFTCDLRFISEWLKACRITTVAMEATGIYWINIYFYLQREGFDVVLANPTQVKSIAGKKTDEIDAEWIMLLHSYGILKQSFHPDDTGRKIRTLCRHRAALVRSASKEVQHMQKAMEMMNIKLSTVISDILGKSGRAIIDAILRGNHDPHSLSLLADGRCRASKGTIEKSLEGTWDEDLLFILHQSVSHYDYIQDMIYECDIQTETLLRQYECEADTDMAKLVRANKRDSQKNTVCMDVEAYAYAIWGTNVKAIPGMNSNSIMKLIGELGKDFAGKFDTCRKFCAWLNIVPENKITGGKLISSHVQKRKNPAGQVFRECANTLKDSKTEMGVYFRRIKARTGHIQAIVASAHKMAKIFYTMIKEKKEYKPQMVGLTEEQLLERRIKQTQKRLEALKKKKLDSTDQTA